VRRGPWRLPRLRVLPLAGGGHAWYVSAGQDHTSLVMDENMKDLEIRADSGLK
jgi:hypothetical protein